MNSNTTKVIVVLAASLVAGLPVAHADSNDGLLAHYGMFQLENNDVQTVNRSKNIKAYRVCVEEKDGAVPLKVLHGGEETIVEPGDCQLVEASRIKLAAVGRMPAGTTMIGRFNDGDTSKYSTTISVARSAP